jgi:type IV secretory pathway VirB10-like protein
MSAPSLALGGDPKNGPRIRRLNRLPLLGAIALVLVFLALIVYGLSSRGLTFGGDRDRSMGNGQPAASDADRLKRGIPDGIIEAPQTAELHPLPPPVPAVSDDPFKPRPDPLAGTAAGSTGDVDEVWRVRLSREQEEQWLRELHRQRMASLQADGAALNAPIAIDLGALTRSDIASSGGASQLAMAQPNALDFYAAALQSAGQDQDSNGQASKSRFMEGGESGSGVLSAQIEPARSPYELKRGSIIPATLITGINSDLPGHITAQVSQNVFDSATGRHLLIPQGTKLLGRYDSEVVFGQSRVLVVWTDLIFSNGSTLRIGSMAGTDMSGYAGFADKVDRHHLQTFGSAVLVALIGAGTEMLMPNERGRPASEAGKGLGQTMGKLSEQTISRNLDVQPTLEIRPGYLFNILVKQDLTFTPTER